MTDKRSEGAESLTVQKFYQLGKHSVVWGYVGEDDIGRAMRVFVDSLEITDWPTLTEACGTKIRELNVQAGMFHHPTGILVAGYLAKNLGLWAIDDGGDARSDPDAMFYGWGRISARRMEYRSILESNDDNDGAVRHHDGDHH